MNELTIDIIEALYNEAGITVEINDGKITGMTAPAV